MAKIKDFRLKIQDARKDKQEAIKEFGEDSFQVHQVDQELFDLMWCAWYSICSRCLGLVERALLVTT